MSHALPHKKIIAVLPAYHAVRTLKQTFDAIPSAWVDEVILVDDASGDDTAVVSRALGITTIVHAKNRGYGGNQKTCYREALAAGADIVVMVHPDFQYDPSFIPKLIQPIADGAADAMFGSRMLTPGGARAGGMPLWKYVANIILTAIGNAVLGLKLSEYHSGFRAYSRSVLERCPIELNSDNFVFDTEIIVQLKRGGFRVGEIPITTRYFPEASMIGFWKSVEYGLSFLATLGKYALVRLKIADIPAFRMRSPDREPCPLCGGVVHTQLYPRTAAVPGRDYAITDATIAHEAILRCGGCSVAFVPRKNIPDLSALYRSQPFDAEYCAEERGRRKTARRVLRKIARLTGGGRGALVDVGAGPGFFVGEAKRFGFDAYGIEAGEVWLEYANKNASHPVLAGGYERLREFPDEFFSAITAWDVIEHVADPREMVALVAQKLSPGGVFAFSTPRIDSATARLLGPRWHALISSHITFFGSKTIRMLLEGAGLRVAAERSYRRYFSIRYLLNRLFRRSGDGLLRRIVVPVNLFDEMEIYAVKRGA